MSIHFALDPSPFLVRFAHLLPRQGRALDLACGSGRHARFLAARGLGVLAVDRDAAALASLAGHAGIETRAVDLETGLWPFAMERFDAIVVTNYLHRPLLPHLLATLSPDGVFVYETFAAGNQSFGRPSNPHFLLAPDELLVWARDHLTPVVFEQGLVRNGERAAVIQRLVGVGRGRPWPPLLAP